MKKQLQFTLLLSLVVLLSSFTSKTKTEEKSVTVSTLKDMSILNAALIHPNGKAYFFIRDNYRRYNIQTDRLEKKGKINKDGWKGVSKNVDAAFIHPHNKKTYFFSGNSYYRYDFIKKRVDKKGIIGVDGWKGLDGPIDAVIMHPTNNSAYFFKGKKYHRYSFSKKKFDKEGTIGVNAWKGVPTSMSAALVHSNGKAYFFKGDHYYRFDFNKHKVDKKGVLGRDGWRGLYPRLDAIVYNKEHNNLHTFKGKTMTSVHRDYYDANDENSFNFLISWAGLFYMPDTKFKYSYHNYRMGYDSYNGIPSNVDASFRRGSNERYYFFKESKYYRWNPKTKKVDKTANITDGFKGVPTNLDAVTGVTGGAYFFKGTNYYHFSFSDKKVIATGAISSKFRGMPNYPDAAATFYNKKQTYTRVNGKPVRVTVRFNINDIVFFKNNISYYRLKNKRIKWQTINKNLLK